ncbi:MAG: hypothetical protein U0L45_01050 [Alistipes sp.]|jgi:hypothetical protein|nr:hypothetical protein [Alistipes sp.]
MIPIISLSRNEIQAIVKQLREGFAENLWRPLSSAKAMISAATTEVEICAQYDGCYVWIDGYKCLDEDSNNLAIVESDLYAIEQRVIC